MAGDLPLPTLLSQVLVAFTIELDNEFERLMAHRTTVGSAGDARTGPWLVSLVMWSNLMRFVGEQGVPVADVQDAGGNLEGMKRWGWVVVGPDPADPRPRPPRRDWVVRPTAAGRRAREVWPGLFDVVEERWQARFGGPEIARLQASLAALAGRLELASPAYLPVLGYGLRAKLPGRAPPPPAPDAAAAASALTLPAALSKVLLAFALEFERESEVSLAVGANVLRLLDEEGVRVRDLPRRSGVAKEAIAMALGLLERGRYAIVEPDPAAGRTKLVRLTAKGREARDAYRRVLDATEAGWRTRFGSEDISELRESLERLVGESGGRDSTLFLGLEPDPDGWRASIRRPEALPHHPMVLHRGGYPDGS